MFHGVIKLMNDMFTKKIQPIEEKLTNSSYQLTLNTAIYSNWGKSRVLISIYNWALWNNSLHLLVVNYWCKTPNIKCTWESQIKLCPTLYAAKTSKISRKISWEPYMACTPFRDVNQRIHVMELAKGSGWTWLKAMKCTTTH